MPYRAVLDALVEGQASGDRFEEIWATLTLWPGDVTFIVHTLDGVFETRGLVPSGRFWGRGFFNIHGASPIGGHIPADRCAAIDFVDRPFFGRRSYSVQLVNRDGEAMFKIFVGRDKDRELNPEQVARFTSIADTL